MSRKLTKAAHRRYLEQILGEDASKGFKGILDIAEGRTTYRQLVREPAPHENVNDIALIAAKEVVPTIRERLDAWQFLVEHLVGKPTVEVNANITERKEFDYSNINDDEIEKLESLLRRTSIAAHAVVDGEVIDETKALPAPPEIVTIPAEPHDPAITTFQEAAKLEPALAEAFEELVERPHEDLIADARKLFAGKKAKFG